MTNADLCVKEEVEVDPIKQNRNQQENLLPSKSACRRLGAPRKIAEQCHQKYDLRRNRDLEEGGVKVIAWEATKCAVMTIDSKLPCHIDVSPTLPHPLLELDQIQALNVRHW